MSKDHGDATIKFIEYSNHVETSKFLTAIASIHAFGIYCQSIIHLTSLTSKIAHLREMLREAEQ
ncbi:MAG: hypothetical protein ACOC0N_10855 [Chroococcales cyanobacterium]